MVKFKGTAAVICAVPAVVPGVNWAVMLDEPAGTVTGEVTVPALVLSECKDTDSVRPLGAGAKAWKFEPFMLELLGSNWTNETPMGTAAPPLDAVNEEVPSSA